MVIPRRARLMEEEELTSEEVLARSVVMDMYVTICLVQQVNVDCYY